MINKSKLGEYLKKLRSEKKENGKSFTLEKVAEKMDISVNAVKDWENGKSIPSLDKLQRLADLYNKTVDEILEAEDREKIDYNEKYFIVEKDWYLKYNPNDTYLIRNKQIKEITKRFKELVLIRMNRYFKANEEEEFKFLFKNFYNATDYCKFFSIKSEEDNNKYILFKDALENVIVETKEMDVSDRFWEIQKLYSEKKEIRFSFNNDILDLTSVKILQERFDVLENWQKDMMLAMYQNLTPYYYDPNRYSSKSLKRFEEQNGEYNFEKTKKESLKFLIKHGACINRYFFNIRIKKKEENKIIDRLEELYKLCLKPLDVYICENGEYKKFKVENNEKNRFLKDYYYDFKHQLFNHEDLDLNEDTEEIYNWFIKNDKVPEEVYLKIARNLNIDTNTERKYWIADVKSRSQIDKIFDRCKTQENKIRKCLLEIDRLEKSLEKGEKTYFDYKYSISGGKDEQSIYENIESWKENLNYSEFLSNRNENETKKLFKDIDKLSFDEIKEKYFYMETIEDE